MPGLAQLATNIAEEPKFLLYIYFSTSKIGKLLQESANKYMSI